MSRGGARGGPGDVGEPARSSDDGLENIAGEVTVSGSEGEENGSEGFELGEVEVVRGEAREDFGFFAHRGER